MQLSLVHTALLWDRLSVIHRCCVQKQQRETTELLLQRGEEAATLALARLQ